MKTELLAPAGDIEAAYSAFYFGADAVYLGLRRFSARAEAINFSPEDLDEITAFAHAHQKKVYVALNTLMQENELPELMTYLQICADCKVDALITQDIGVARIVKKAFPQLVLHASTQMAIHNLSGALALKKLGFERVVLARELSLAEIRDIQQKSGMEVEVFIHGALCYSYSGLCAFSSMTTARSANRGKCVYSCRDTFKMNGKQYHPFSMKDLALEKDVCDLKGLSLKIEGRKKNALYVGAVTDYYRRILDTGKVDGTLSDNLKQIFARPWTKLHFRGKNKDVIEPDFVGHRGLPIGTVSKVFNKEITFKTAKPLARYDGIQIDIPGMEKPFGFSAEYLTLNGKSVFEVSADKTVSIKLPPKSPFIQKGSAVYLASSTYVKSAYPYEKPKKGLYRNKQAVEIDIYVGSAEITAVSQDVSVSLTESLSPAKDSAKVIKAINECFRKTGDTPFETTSVRIHNPDDLFVPVSLLNQLRRNLFEALSAHIREAKKIPTLPETHLKKGSALNIKPKWRLKTDDVSVLKGVDLSKIDEVIIEISAHSSANDFSFLPKEKVRLALPVIIRSQAIEKTVHHLYEHGYHKWQIGNWGGLRLIPSKAETDIDFDSTIPVLNTQAVAFAHEASAGGITCSPEDTYDNIQKLLSSSLHTTLIVYQDTPLFLSANCIRPNTCADCTHQTERYTLSNGKERFEAVSKECLTTVIKNEPFYIGHLINNLSPEWLRMDFCNRAYTSAQINRLIQIIQAGKPLKSSYSGNFKKSFA